MHVRPPLVDKVVVVDLPSLMIRYPNGISDHSQQQNGTISHNSIINVQNNILENNLYFKYIYLVGLTWLVTYIIPLGILAVLNVKLIQGLQKAGRRHAQLINQSDTSNKESMSVTLNIIAVVLVFLIFQTLDFVQIVVQQTPTGISGIVLNYTSTMALCLLALNCDANFFIYCLFYSKFRKSVVEMCGCRQKEKTVLSGKAHSSSRNTSNCTQV